MIRSPQQQIERLIPRVRQTARAACHGQLRPGESLRLQLTGRRPRFN
jgi:hypothetical protein